MNSIATKTIKISRKQTDKQRTLARKNARTTKGLLLTGFDFTPKYRNPVRAS